MRLSLLLCLPLASIACQRLMTHQPRYNPYSGSDFFGDGTSAQRPPEHTVPREFPAAVATGNVFERGRERYAIYCIACHSPLGDGDGIVVRRGFPAPPSFHQDRLRNAPDAYLEQVIKTGMGKMYRLGDRIGPADRRAIVAYVRALQLSQHAAVAELPIELRKKLGAQP